MFACCQLCYEKYIEADGTIDEVRLDQAREKLIVPQVLEKNGIPTDRFVVPCSCPCHKDGMNVMH
jgi:hypothetical protein